MKKLDFTAAVLLLVAALNWGLVGIFEFNLVTVLFDSPAADRTAYGVFGLSAIYTIVNWRGIRERWAK